MGSSNKANAGGKDGAGKATRRCSPPERVVMLRSNKCNFHHFADVIDCEEVVGSLV
jgi:hypothetical protein